MILFDYNVLKSSELETEENTGNKKAVSENKIAIYLRRKGTGIAQSQGL